MYKEVRFSFNIFWLKKYFSTYPNNNFNVKLLEMEKKCSKQHHFCQINMKFRPTLGIKKYDKS